MEAKLNTKISKSNDEESTAANYASIVQNKKVVKHALRQQVKRRRKNTTIAAGTSRLLPKIIHTLPATTTAEATTPGNSSQQATIVIEETAATMKEVLASLPGFSIKSNRRRSTKKLSVAAQLEAGLVDLESPASILASISLRALLNRHTFLGLPPLYQRKLAQLLPIVDRQDAPTSGLNNEFFARACQEWRKRLVEGEFTPENQQRLKVEEEKDKNKLDPWKLKHFEPIWGEKREIHKLKYGLQLISKEQKFLKNEVPTTSLAQTESILSNVSPKAESLNQFSEEDKIEQNMSSLGEMHSISETDQRIASEFDEDDDEEEDEQEEDDDDGDDEDEDEEEDDDDEDDDDEDDEEDEDEIETQAYPNVCYQEDDIIKCEESNNTPTEITEAIDLDSETLQRIHELDVRGEMQEVYEEIAGCTEEIINPLLDEINLDSTDSKTVETTILPENIENQGTNDTINTCNQEEALQEANNYVCSEMLDCNWTNATNDNTSSIETDLQVSWPLVAETLQNTEATAITINEPNEFNESSNKSDLITDQISQQNQIEEVNFEQNTPLDLPVATFEQKTLNVETPVTSCVIENVQINQNPPEISLSQTDLQPMQFIKTDFQITPEPSSSQSMPNPGLICAQLPTPSGMAQPIQSNVNSVISNIISQKTMKDILKPNFDVESEMRTQVKNAATVKAPQQYTILPESSIVIQQHQPLVPSTSRQIITAFPPQPQTAPFPVATNVQYKVNRYGLQQTQRSPRNRNKEPSNRPRNTTKEPPGTVNLERSYQICQAVIANSPNRDQLKAHLKPPPSLLSKVAGTLTVAAKPQKQCDSTQSGSFAQTKAAQAGAIPKQIYATAARDAYPEGVGQKQLIGNAFMRNSVGQ